MKKKEKMNRIMYCLSVGMLSAGMCSNTFAVNAVQEHRILTQADVKDLIEKSNGK